MSKGIQSYLLL